MIDRSIAPEYRGIENINLVTPGHEALPNGSNLYYFNGGGQELLRIEWIFGNLHFNPEKPLLNMAANTMLTEGTSQLTAAQIADKVDFYGAFLQTDYGFDQSQVTLYTLSKHLDKILPVIQDILTDSVFPEEELQTYIRNQQQKLQVGLQKNDVLARRAFNKAMHGDTLYGYAPEIDDYARLKREDLQTHYKAMYQPANCTIVAAGKIDESALQLLKDTFGNQWNTTSGEPDLNQPEIQPATEKFYFIEKPDALQSAIRIGLHTINRPHPDFPAMQVLNTVLGGYFGSRLMANIREDKGYTYGIGSGMTSLKHGGAMFIATEVGADVCRDAVKEIEKEITLLKTELIEEEELSLVKNYMLGSLLGSLENIFSHADKFKNVYFSGMDLDYYHRYTEVVKTVTAEQLRDLTNKYLDYDNMFKVIVGKY
ncbi:M16 family metallopeptidase [Mucilaginibacter sp. KACC 22063]|uniref:M16 family metallopeptidase n=1 Tax=Mucilaginibacter sp. KACC 22063 TaxID=3025666 RepID=UPI002365FDA7|nr:pitrilysin family protein [Mucilaginibacter sp. KACC 22063]WDF53856.1 pitrilysin family protein [Mucilaginibacter sp. KACC 22063]